MSKGKEFGQQLSDFVNGASRTDWDEVARFVVDDHRTLQQSEMGLFMKCIEAIADQSRCDGRNEEAVKLANTIMMHLTDDDIYLPLI